MIPIYITSSLLDYDNIKNYINVLKDMGYILTHDWTNNPSKDRSIEDDIEGIKNASAIIVIMEKETCTYKAFSSYIGCGLILNIPIFVYNKNKLNYNTDNIFYWYSNIKKYDNFNKLINDISKIIPKKLKIINGKEASKNSRSYILKNSHNTLSLLKDLIDKSSNKGYKSLEFKFKNKQQDFKYISDELTRLNFEVSFNMNTIYIKWK